MNRINTSIVIVFVLLILTYYTVSIGFDLSLYEQWENIHNRCIDEYEQLYHNGSDIHHMYNRSNKQWLYHNRSNKHIFNQIFGDQVYCICLKSREDRYKSACDQLEKIGLDANDINFYRPEKDLRGGIYGCWNSHREVIKQGYDSEAPYWLILEDDFIFTPYWCSALMKLREFIASNNSWHIINLHNQGVEIKSLGDFYYGYGASNIGYIISRRYMQYKGFIDGYIPPAIGQHLDVAFFIDQKSPIYTPLKIYSNNGLITITSESQSDNNYGFLLELIVKILGYSTAWSIEKNINTILCKINNHLPRYTNLSIMASVEKEYLGYSISK